MTEKPFVLPPLPPRPTYHWLEAQLLSWRQDIARRRVGASIGKRFGYAILNRITGRLLRSGRKFPLLYRLWYAVVGRIAVAFVPAGRETSLAHLVRRTFKREPPDHVYHGGYVVLNFITAIVLLLIVYMSFGSVVESSYILLTYRHDKYTNVIVTSHYRDFTAPHQFAVHGKTLTPNGDIKEELYFEIGPSFWFQEYNPEFVFGKISDNAVCDFDAYGTLVRFPLALRYLTKDSLFVLNPWIVDVRCKTPTQH